jgi:hypothetical protein
MGPADTSFFWGHLRLCSFVCGRSWGAHLVTLDRSRDESSMTVGFQAVKLIKRPKMYSSRYDCASIPRNS